MSDIFKPGMIGVIPRFMRVFHSGFGAARSKNSLNSTQQRTLLMLADSGTMHMNELHEHFNLDKGAFSRVVQGLSEAGYIERWRDSDDRRCVSLRLTEGGQEEAGKIRLNHDAVVNKTLSVLDSEQQLRLAEALKTIDEITCILREHKIDQ